MGCACEGDYIVDHINGNTLDNRKQNLRFCTPTENHRNSKVFKNSISGYKGVGFHVNKWRARIMFNKKAISIGEYNTPEEAAIVYDKKAIELFGEYAYTNFPKENYIREQQ